MTFIVIRGAKMQIKEYQQRVLERVEQFLDALMEHTNQKQKIDEALQNVGLPLQPYLVNEKAWTQVVGNARPYKPYTNGIGKDIPFICLKVPTGGGKTYLAARCVDLIQRKFVGIQTGLVLWVVPTSSIYAQTLKALRQKDHPYRVALDMASGGKTMIVEKDEGFTPQDTQGKLIVLLLMLASGRDLDGKRLRLYKAGGYARFFPDEGILTEHKLLLERFPNLDVYDEGIGETLVKTSLGNVIRICQPVIILDESHRARADLSTETLQKFNPSFVLELSATPARQQSNILASVSGKELHQEEMIKLDLNAEMKEDVEWTNTLLKGHEKRVQLEQIAARYRANKGAYIRPIAVISVQNTDPKKRDKRSRHVEDVREYLIATCNIPTSQIAIKSAYKDELKDIDLMSSESDIRYIITGDALKEGWDCPFAYVLIILKDTKARDSITQLIGRILRQPYARKLPVEYQPLNESYVYCYQTESFNIVTAIGDGFSNEGLDDLRERIISTNSKPEKNQRIAVSYREPFRQWTIYLPRFVAQESNQYRPISYQRDILPYIDWSRLDINRFNIQLTYERRQEHRFILGLDAENQITRIKERSYEYEYLNENPVIDHFYYMRQISDLVPNDWRAYQIVENMLKRLREAYQYSDEIIANHPADIAEALRRFLKLSLEGYYGNELNPEVTIGLAGEVFHQKIDNKEILFYLDKTLDFQLPKTFSASQEERQLVHTNNQPMMKTLWEWERENQFNELEKSVAYYLDEQHNLLWWYRHLPNSRYSLVGWRNSRIFPDYVAAVEGDYSKIFVLETKGIHLAGNDDTRYKQDIFDLCNRLGKEIDWKELGEDFRYKEVAFSMIYDVDWKDRIRKIFD
jgi:type III restriction enzyme